MEPSPEPTVDLLPRLCHLVKGEHGYGFNLHSDKTKRGQFVRSVDPGSAAESADIRPGDRLVEVVEDLADSLVVTCKHFRELVGKTAAPLPVLIRSVH